MCGSAAEACSTQWRCSNVGCNCHGPDDDPDAAKWNKLHGLRKLPIKPPFVVVMSTAFPVVALRELKKGDRFFANALGVALAGKDHEREKIERPILGDPIDISEFLE